MKYLYNRDSFLSTINNIKVETIEINEDDLDLQINESFID
jgi:hypothetical protein